MRPIDDSFLKTDERRYEVRGGYFTGRQCCQG